MKNLNFGTKLLIILLGTVIVLLGIMIAVTTSISYKAIDKEAKAYVKKDVEQWAKEIKSDLDLSISSVNSMEHRLTVAIENGEKLTKSGMVEFQKDILKDNDLLFASWITFEDDSYLFSRNDGSSSAKYYTKSGVFSPYVIKEDNKFLVTAVPDFDKTKVFVKTAYEQRRIAISEPYIDSAKKILVLSISKPVIIKGKVIGIVGVDFEIDKLDKVISKLQILDAGYFRLINNHEVVLSHRNKDRLGKPYISNANADIDGAQALKNAKAGKEYEYYGEAAVTGNKSYFVSYPFEFGNTGLYWTLIGSVPEAVYLSVAHENTIFSIVFAIVIIIIIALVVVFNMKTLSKNLSTISEGLLSFFAFLNKENKDVKLILDSNDEFGTMAKVINENIHKTQNLLVQDEALINDVKKVVDEVKAGYLDKRVEKVTENQGLEELKNSFNEMLENTMHNVCSNINKVVEVLDSFGKLDFRAKIQNDKGKIAVGINNLSTIINNMLKENKANGLTLEQSSKILLENVDKLNVSSNEAAASLEETAAALEEITSNIRNNTQSIAQMSKISNDVTNSAKNGETLANKTTIAMDEINVQVNLVNEAISVIDNIAFQTNILSLNAAVEAATAGEAGKGFAVVAQEVRNLAARSAEAAKEIKDIVERATIKANEGKQIATTMIEGYKELNENINQTATLISDIEMSSKEQLTGIEQINDAVNELDIQTQQNASVASQTNDIALASDEIAKLIVQDANAKEFIGKDEVKAKTISKHIDTTNKVNNEDNKAKDSNNTSSSNTNKTNKVKSETKENNSSKDDDEWESF